MIEQTVEDLTMIIGTRPACRALGASPATIYRRRRPPVPRPVRPRAPSPRALSGSERDAVLAELHSERFVDSAPAAVWATLPDEGRYLASERTMYRLLASEHGPGTDRRDQLSHLPYAAPELLAEQPNEVYSSDITKLKGPAKGTYFYLYVILDVYSRYAVGWTVQHRENSLVAKDLIAQVCQQQHIGRDQLTVHADRGSSMTSKPRRVPARRPRRPQDPQPAIHLDRQPLQRGAVQDAEVPARVPRTVRFHRTRPRVLPPVLHLVQRRASPLRDRPEDPGRRAPRARRGRPRPRPGRRLRRDSPAVRAPPAATTSLANRRLDQ